MRIVTFGEAMLRFSPPSESSLEKAELYRVEVAGAEANVAVALARLGHDVTFLSRLPRNPLGRRIAGRIREHGVDTSHIVWTDDGRVGLYFVEIGPPPRPRHVTYDRAHSAFARGSADEIDLSVLDGAGLLHTTGITVALGASGREGVERLMRAALERQIPISFDVNYRSKLWSPQQARDALEPLLARVRFLFLSSHDADMVLGVAGTPDDQVRQLGRRYPAAIVVLTCGAEGAWAWDGSPHYQPVVPGTEMDRIGRGDAFCAGYLFGFWDGGTARGLSCGAGMAALAQTYVGDLTWSTRSDLLAVVQSDQRSPFR